MKFESKYKNFHWTKINFKMPSAKSQPFCSGLMASNSVNVSNPPGLQFHHVFLVFFHNLRPFFLRHRHLVLHQLPAMKHGYQWVKTLTPRCPLCKIMSLLWQKGHNFAQWTSMGWCKRDGTHQHASAVYKMTCAIHDDVIKWKHFPHYWPFVWGIHRSPVNSPHKDQWRGTLMFSLICIWINGWVNNSEAGDLRRHRAHYGVIVMNSSRSLWLIYIYRNVPIRSALPNRSAPQMSLHIVTE